MQRARRQGQGQGHGQGQGQASGKRGATLAQDGGHIGAEAAALGIPVFDLFEVYRDIEGRRLPVTPFTNPHPNELAHRLAADAILDELVGAELLPPIRYRFYRRLRVQHPPESDSPTTQ